MTPGGRDTLLDTGPLVAVLDGNDQRHSVCAEAWDSFAARCVTTEAVITEATHLVARGGGAPELVLELLLAGDVPILGLDTEGHRSAALLMRRYRDTPMDYADATLVLVAEWLGAARVFTLDRRGFRTYRRARGTAFALVPGG